MTACWVFCAGCEPKTIESTFLEPESSRPYRVIVGRESPEDESRPVLFVLHPYATSPDVVVDGFELRERVVESLGWIVVVPRGIEDASGSVSWNATAACCGSGSARPDDLGYLGNVLGDLHRRFEVDAGRVFALGVSNGAFMAHRWACTPGGAIRKIVAISGVGPGPDDPPCQPTVPVSVLQVHGDRDVVIRYDGGTRREHPYPSVEETLGVWCRVNGCKPHSARQRRTGLFVDTMDVWERQGESAHVVLWTIVDGAHQLPRLARRVSDLIDFLAHP